MKAILIYMVILKPWGMTLEEKQEVLIRSYFQPDDHNILHFLLLPDERIMIFTRAYG